MRHVLLWTVCLVFLAVGVGPLHAQSSPTGARPGNVIGTGQSLPLSNDASNIEGTDTRSAIAPRLPTPETGDDAAPVRFLQDAKRALAAGRTGEAQEAIERAESRLLDRDVAPRQAGQPSRQRTVTAVEEARRILATGDRMATLRAIDRAIDVIRRK